MIRSLGIRELHRGPCRWWHTRNPTSNAQEPLAVGEEREFE